MNIEYEARFININKDSVHESLKQIGAKQIHPEFLQKRVVFNLPKGHEIPSGWLRVRQEYDKITMSLKMMEGRKITDTKETCLEVNSFDEAVMFLEKIGCVKKAYQENKRELWEYNHVEICIDEWPFLEPFVEIEGKSEGEVKKVSELLGFDYNNAMFGAADMLIAKKYNISTDMVNNHIPLIVFGDKNPYLGD